MSNYVIYIDNDNIKFSKYEKIIYNLFSNFNRTTKIFLNENDLINLNNVIKLKYNIYMCNSPVKSKNSADISLVIECMKDLYTNKYDKFIIISNDTDFIPLCKEIRSNNKKCILCYDGNFNTYLNEIYNETYNLSHLLKIENDKITKELEKQKRKEIEKQKQIELQKKEELEKQKRKEIEKQKQIELQNQLKIKKQNEIKKIEKLTQYKKNEVYSILDIVFSNDINSISFDGIVKIFNKYKFNYGLDVDNRRIKLKKFLELYLPNIYYIKNNNIYIK